MSAEDTVAIEFYSVWPNLGKKLSEQLGEIRTDTSSLAPVVRGIGLDASGDFSDLDGVAKTAVQAYEIGKQDFHNKFRTHYNKTNDLFEIAYNNGTTESPNWYTTWWINKDGNVTQQNTPTTASNVGSGEGWFKQKVGVDLEFKTITATSPITLVNDGDSLDVDGSALISNYSTLGGDEALITTKSSNNLPFKGLSAGPNVVLTASGTDIQIESTAQVVEFYGIVVQHTDGTAIFPGVHVLKVDPNAFYLVAPTSGRSAETILGFRGETLVSSSFVAVIGDEMTGPLLQADGLVGAPSFSWTADTDTGIWRNAADDMAFVSGGANIARVLTDRLLVSKRLQVTAAGDATTPDIFWNDDSTTGLFQNTPSDDSIAFSTAGVRAGYFDSAQDLFVTNEIKAGDGAVGAPAFSFSATGQTDVGMYRKTTDQLAFATGGVLAGYFDASQDLYITNEIYSGAGTSGAPAYSFTSDPDIGMYRRGTNELGFATQAVERAYFDTSGNGGGLHVITVITVGNGTKTIPSLNFTSSRQTGIYQSATDELGFTAADTDVFDISATYLSMYKPIRLYGGSDAAPGITGPVGMTGVEDTGIWFSSASGLQFTTGGGRAFQMSTTFVAFNFPMWANFDSSVAAPAYSFFPDVDTGITQNVRDDDSLVFATAGVRAGYFDANQDLYVTNELYTGDGAIGAPGWSFSSDPDTGIYQHADDDIRITAGGVGKLALRSSGVTPLVVTTSNITGSVTAPAYAWNQDSNTGLYSTAHDDTINFATGGARAGYFDANQNLFVTNTLTAKTGNFTMDMNSPTGTFYTAVDIGTGAPGDSIIEFLDQGTLKYTVGHDTSRSALILTSGPLDDTNDEIVITPDLVTIDKLAGGRVEAGIGVFYTSTTTDRLILTRSGIASKPAIQFPDEDTGFFEPFAGAIDITCNGADRWRFGTGQHTSTEPLRSGMTDGSATTPDYSFADDNNTGMWQTDDGTGFDKLNFATGGVNAGYFDANQNLFVTNDVRASRVHAGPSVFYIQDEGTSAILVSPGSGTNPAIASTVDTDTGIRWSSNGIIFNASGGTELQVDSTFVRHYDETRIPDGSASDPNLTFASDLNTGLFRRGDDELGFATAGAEAGYFDANQNLHVQNDVRAGRVEAGIGKFYTYVEVATTTGVDEKQLRTAGGETGIMFDDSGNRIVFTVDNTTHATMDFNRFIGKSLRMSNSSLAAPALHSFWDTNSGFHVPGFGGSTGRVSLVTDGVEALIADPSQNIIVPNDVHAGRVHAGIGVFYTSTTTGGITIAEHLIGTPDAITAASAGTAASLATLNTEVTTNDDNDLDNVTLANGTSGQVKHIYCVVSFAGDTWKITPATMAGGSIITFGDNSVGDGCILVYADNEGWVVLGNNGGTIS